MVQRDLLANFNDWKIERASAHGDASFGTLTPSYSAYHDAGDLPALLLPAGTTLSYTFPDGDAEAILRCAAGVDLTVPRSLRAGARPLRVRFEARLDGELVLEEIVSVAPTAPNRQVAEVPQVWHWLGNKQAGLNVHGGQTLSLHVDLVGKKRPKLTELRFGFGELVTETQVSTPRTEASAERPNIILVVMDTERGDRTSLHGYHKSTTPNLDALASRGVSFDDAWATAPWTWPSTASILTGLETPVHGVTGNEACYLRHELATLPKLLQERGFTTAGFSGNPLIVADKNFDGGFEHFVSDSRFRASDEVLPEAFTWLRQNSTTRFFLYLHLVDPHDPHRPLEAEMERLGGSRPTDYSDRGYIELGTRLRKRIVEVGPGHYDYKQSLAPGEEQWINDSYDACVATGDHYLGKLLRLVDELQLTEKTVIAYTSDHGEELFEHGLTNHAHTLHPELLHVPLVIAGPGIPIGERVSKRLSNRHLGPTLALFGGGELPVSDALNLLDPELQSEGELFFQTTKGIWNDWAMVEIFGLLEKNWSLHWAPKGLPYRTLAEVDPGLGQWKLYDRRVDPGEHQDVAAKYPVEAERMRLLIQAWREEKRQGATSFGAGAATRNLLEGVGYIELGSDD
ncbi:MAG: arylsulfatase [Planctomycetota bacterium]|jgi:arylsulfatase